MLFQRKKQDIGIQIKGGIIENSWEFGDGAKGPPLNILTLLPRTKLHLQKYHSHSHSYTQHGALPRKGNVWKIIFFFIKRTMGTKQTREWSIKIILCVV